MENYFTIHTKVKHIPPLWFSNTPRFLYPRRMNTDVYQKTCSCMFIAASCTENKPNIHQQQKRWTLKYSYNGTLHKKREGERREKETTNTHDTTCPKSCCKGKIQSQVQWLQILCFMEEIGCPVGVCVCVWVTQSCPTLCDPMDYSLPGSSVLGILQARILEWVAISFPRICRICINGEEESYWKPQKFGGYLQMPPR